MIDTSIRARALACALLASTAYCGLAAQPAAAQMARQHRALDPNGVDLTHGDFFASFVEGSIGSGEAELALVRKGVWSASTSNNGHDLDDVLLVQDRSSGTVNNVFLGGGIFVQFNNTDRSPDGSATLSGEGSSYVYTAADGTQVAFGNPLGSSEDPSNLCNGNEAQLHCSLLPLSITSPGGKTVAIGWDVRSNCPFGGTCTYYTRIASFSNSFGYRIAFAYAENGHIGVPTSAWFQRTGASFYNDLVSTSVPQASTGYAHPSLGVTEVTDTGGRVWRFAGTSTSLTAIRRPGATSDTTTIAYSIGDQVSSVTKEGVTTSYSRSVSGTTATMTVTNALDQATIVVSDLVKGRPTSVTDPLNRTTSYQYDAGGRLERVTQPEGNYVHYTYDSRGNVTTTMAVPKGGTGPTIVASASYDPACANPVTCNQPNSTTDERGNTTDYSYDPVHGGVRTVTLPAPTAGAVRPQTRYSYTLINGEYRLTGISRCQTTSSCAGTADEATSTIDYDSNGNLISTTSGNGSGTLIAASAMTYDAIGNLVAVDGPLDGPADTSRIRYDGARQVVGTISPDPDGTGPRKHLAVRNSYTNGLLTKVEQGNVDSQSDSAWAAFAPAQAVETDYDGHARPVTSRLTAGSTVYALTQTSYDALGRPECVAQRMDSADFGSTLPGACSPTSPAGGFGPDRIVKTIYDSAGQVTQVKVALGTADEADEVTTTYTDNGLVRTVTDGENNKTTFDYDGHDRLSVTRYPLPAKGAGASSTTDYEQTTYESLAGGTRTSGLAVAFRNRAAETTGFTYDALGQLTAKDLPGSEPDVGFGYDLLGRMTSANFAATGLGLGWEYDALGRLRAATGNLHGSRTLQHDYDPAGNRTGLTHPDGTVFLYDYDSLGRMTALKDHLGATQVAFSYDDQGRRKRLDYANGAVTTYGYDAVSRLAQLSHDLAGTTHDLTYSYAYSPASQIISRTGSNDLYAWSGHGSGTTNSSANGLNQLDRHAGAAVTHDARGNLTSEGGRSFGYDSENKLTSGGGFGVRYDPLGRFLSLANPSPFFLLDTDGADIVSERSDGDPVAARYAYGPGIDEPLLQYQGSGSSTRRYYHADERGSIVAVSDASGALYRILAYDEYGRPSSAGNRFLHAGKMFLGGWQLYYNNARFYDPKLGRFLQPDPIGYEGGMNLYAYVKGDPVNLRDPLGLAPQHLECTGTRICRVHDSSGNVSGSVQVFGDINGFASRSSRATGSSAKAGADPAPGSDDGPSAPGWWRQHWIDGIPQGWFLMGEASFLGVAHGSTASGSETGHAGLSPKQLKLAQRDMIRACAASQTSQACQDAKALYSSLLEAYNSQTPLPPIPRFKEVRPPLWEVVVGLGGCVLTVSNPAGWVASLIGAAGCASGAKSFGEYMIPKQVRQ